ncbi:MAG TPA: spore protease YyaC [Bacillota bacterium]|nr:spore protease YyaC [Bacillota bacterium]
MGPFRSISRDTLWRSHIDDPTTPERIFLRLHSLIINDLSPPVCRPVLFFCIGTDRSTGDALGPLIGTRLVALGLDTSYVWGTLDFPVHAANLHAAIDEAYSSFQNPYVIAVDACLGRLENVGMVTVSRGPLRPGTGVSKTLPPIGDIHVTGIVNVGGYMEYLVLQNTRLSVVMKMADIISKALLQLSEEFIRLPKEKDDTANAPVPNCD